MDPVGDFLDYFRLNSDSKVIHIGFLLEMQHMTN